MQRCSKTPIPRLANDIFEMQDGNQNESNFKMTGLKVKFNLTSKMKRENAMTDNSDDKAKALANITLFKDTKLYPQSRVLDVAATLLNLEPNGVAFFKSIRR